eukprot:gnl/TRDRNA2_/TRDRNA2_57809_c0_seq1.p1 gnl/TRDRNA2_/TRDRNA2_57809_c0~~gnl/TRDRNA2_/TRDRNA2_57809_c0_seq1.p1  ORF type:complete len:445 (-),score=64.83 gnl/TRDRNA2_/TRDRNA2_57809_c0_seq1:49-1191(-)
MPSVADEPNAAAQENVKSPSGDAMLKMMQHHLTTKIGESQMCFRKEAAGVLEKTGKRGESIDDLQEVPIANIKDKLAISYWRFCEGLRVYRSETVSRALRLICSAPVPGLGQTTYLEVFDKLSNTSWKNHIYVFGGLVRDVIRRTVGNDIDIGFSAPAAELEATCVEYGYICSLDGDYILIGDEKGEEYLEGMVISFNGIQPAYHADFYMNTLFFDFTNNVVIDKTGCGVPAVVGNKLDIPCPRDQWQSWLDVNGVRVLFRYYKFLLRNYEYNLDEMAYVAEELLNYWTRDEENTFEVGRIALGGLVECQDASKIEKLRGFVYSSFNMVTKKEGHKPAVRSSTCAYSIGSKASEEQRRSSAFFTANMWWQRGWKPLLKLQ